MKTWVTFAVLLCCLALTTAFHYKRTVNCADKYSQGKCQQFMKKDKCFTAEARENCGVTCNSCGEACKDSNSDCSKEKVKKELCADHPPAFIFCPRSCDLCIDN